MGRSIQGASVQNSLQQLARLHQALAVHSQHSEAYMALAPLLEARDQPVRVRCASPCCCAKQAVCRACVCVCVCTPHQQACMLTLLLVSCLLVCLCRASLFACCSALPCPGGSSGGMRCEMHFELPLVRHGIIIGCATGVLVVAPSPVTTRESWRDGSFNSLMSGRSSLMSGRL